MHHNCGKNTGKGKFNLSPISHQNEITLVYHLISQLRSEVQANIKQLRTEARKEIDRSIAIIKSQANEKLAQTEIKLIKIIITVIGVSVVIPGFLAIWMGQ